MSYKLKQPYLQIPEKKRIDEALRCCPASFSHNDVYLSLKRIIHVQVLESCTSTNTLLLAEAPTYTEYAQEAPVDVMVTHHQTAGRGQYGRTWFDCPAQSLVFSLRWQLPSHVQSLPVYAAIAMSIAAAESLVEQGFSGIGLKWPNDLLWQKRKLAGLLLEQKKGWAVLGIGINALPIPTEQVQAWGHSASPMSDFSAVSLADMAHSNPRMPNRIDGSQLIAMLIHHFNRMLSVLLTRAYHTFKPLHGRWHALDVACNQSVNFYPTQGAPLIHARYVGLDEDAALCLHPENHLGLQRYRTGQLHLL